VATSFLAALALSASLGVAPANPSATGFTVDPSTEPVAVVMPSSVMVSPLSIASGSITGFGDERDSTRTRKLRGKKGRRPAPVVSNEGLGPERARILLRSLMVPGWGQATLGHKGSARVFILAEAGIWGAFTAFKIQQAHRTDAYLRTARLFAGVDMANMDDEYRRIVGAFASSDEYNLLVVTRDAANLYLSDPAAPDLEGYRRYIAEHSIPADMAWSWQDETSFLRYGDQRKFAQKAGLRANAALGFAIANRLVSALHAARSAGRASLAQPQGWRFEFDPGSIEAGQMRAAFTTNF